MEVNKRAGRSPGPFYTNHYTNPVRKDHFQDKAASIAAAV